MTATSPSHRKVTLNLYRSDCEAMAKAYGWGWSEIVREIVHTHVKSLQPKRKTIGDLLNAPD